MTSALPRDPRHLDPRVRRVPGKHDEVIGHRQHGREGISPVLTLSRVGIQNIRLHGMVARLVEDVLPQAVAVLHEDGDTVAAGDPSKEVEGPLISEDSRGDFVPATAFSYFRWLETLDPSMPQQLTPPRCRMHPWRCAAR